MANTIYLVKRDPNCEKDKVEWIHMSKRRFTRFIKSDAGKGRFFIHLTDDIDYECDEIYIEATRDEYLDWKRTYNGHCYLKGIESETTILSADAPADGSEDPLRESFADESIAVEELITNRDTAKRVMQAIKTLTPKERHLLELLYFGEKQLTDVETAALLGVSHQYVSKAKKKVFLKISKKVGC